MKKPIFVTGNLNKVAYLQQSLDVELEHHHLDLDEIQSADPKVVAEHKARQAYAIIKKPVLIEDTSAGFTALGGLPGPFMKFFVNLEDGLEKLCRIADGIGDRSAYAVGIYAYYDGSDLAIFEGRLNGQIAQHPRGENGFGWDKVFEPDGYGGRTRAELDAEEDVESYNKIRDIEGLRSFLLS